MSRFYRNRGVIRSVILRNGGWYAAAAVTVGILVCAAVLVFVPDQEKSVNSDGNGAMLQTETSPSVSDDSTDFDGSASMSSVSDSGESDEKSETVNAPSAETEARFILPVTGEVTVGFSSTVPVFSETMNDWRVHEGIDFRTDGASDVFAVADGRVENVYESELMGLTVEIRHADNTLSVYRSLGGQAAVIRGQEVRCGEKIGVTGASADAEVLSGTHLHFELIKEGRYLDPTVYFSAGAAG